MSPTKRSGSRRDSTSTTLAQTRVKSKKGRRGKAKEPVLSPEEMFDARKEDWTQERTTEVDAITQRHNGLVSSPPW